jgi:hypothetical protein
MARRVGTPAESARDAVGLLHDHNLAEIGRKLGISRQAIAGWRAVPAEWVRDISDFTGIPRWRLRPDLYDAPPHEAIDAG